MAVAIYNVVEFVYSHCVFATMQNKCSSRQWSIYTRLVSDYDASSFMTRDRSNGTVAV